MTNDYNNNNDDILKNFDLTDILCTFIRITKNNNISLKY